MTNLKETAEMVLNTIYSDNRINTKEYSQLEALQELKNAIEIAISKQQNKFNHL
jgi:predicted RNase H-like HicB family nuclease